VQTVAAAPARMAPRAMGRPRCDVTRKAVLRAAYDLLSEGGLSRFTIEGVAARSGVARTTIYRWWPSKGALAMEGFLEITGPEVHVPPTDSAVGDLRAVMQTFARILGGAAGRIIRGVVAEGQSDPETIEAFKEGWVRPRRAVLRALLERGIASGELRADLDIEMVTYALFGPLYLRMLLNDGLDAAWIDRLTTHALAGCMAPG
jgi:AcrR family transcriptional regulator